jgi:NACHT domain-containing protein/NACHT conflict system protein
MNDPSGDVAAKVAVNIITEAFKFAFNGIKDVKEWVKRQDSKQDFLGIAARKYAHKVESLYNSMRIFGMSSPVALRGIYTKVNILRKLTSSYRFSVEDLERYFEQNSNLSILQESEDGINVVNKTEKIVVLGKPGAGKTTFLKFITLQALDGKFGKKRIPIFVGLKAWSDSNLSLMEFITRQFDICNFPDARDFIENLLKGGKAIILLDGFDEVSRDLQGVIYEIREFVDKNDNNQFILSCRIAAYSYCFPQFTDIEIADFTDEQIETFVNNWFSRDLIKAKLCWQKLKEDTSIRELAAIPLLLTMLCLAFDEALEFPSNRAELYKEAIDALLKKWDASRSINRADIYRFLSNRRKESMFSRIAAITFEKEKYFIPQKLLEQHIADYIQHLPDAKDETLEVDSEAILKAIEAQHGIFVERARRIYSFSHLTFQEYFTAKYIVEHSSKGTLKELVRKHTTDARWREVFLLTSGMLDEADSFLMLLKDQIASIIDKKEIAFLIQTVQESVQTQDKLYKLLPDQGMLSAYDRVRLLTLALKLADEYLELLARLGDLPNNYSSRNVFNADSNLKVAFALATNLTRSIAENNPHDAYATVLKVNTRIFPLSHATKRIFGDTRAALQMLNEIRVVHPVINSALSLSTNPDLSQLVQYLNSNDLLIKCLKTECYISKSTRQEIYDRLLLL